jgi:hypothetical protein
MRPLFLALLLLLFAALPAQAADAQPWPWASKMPPDPALVVLPKVNEVSAKVEGKLVKISVKATAPQGGFSEFALAPRIGDPKDRIFAFDARGRAPQQGPEIETPVTIDVSYSGAPIDSFDILEVFGKDNCIGYSLKESKTVECTSKSISQ